MMYKKNSEDDWKSLGFIGGAIKEKSAHESLVESVVTVKRGAASGPEFDNVKLHIFT